MADWSCAMPGMAAGYDYGVNADDQHLRASPAAHPGMTDEILEPFDGGTSRGQHGSAPRPFTLKTALAADERR